MSISTYSCTYLCWVKVWKSTIGQCNTMNKGRAWQLDSISLIDGLLHMFDFKLSDAYSSAMFGYNLQLQISKPWLCTQSLSHFARMETTNCQKEFSSCCLKVHSIMQLATFMLAQTWAMTFTRWNSSRQWSSGTCWKTLVSGPNCGTDGVINAKRVFLFWFRLKVLIDIQKWKDFVKFVIQFPGRDKYNFVKFCPFDIRKVCLFLLAYW